MPKPFKVCSLVAGTDGLRMLTANDRRTEIGVAGLRWAADEGAQLVVLPAGFLRSRSPEKRDVLESVALLLRNARRLGVAIVIGVDACSPNWGGKNDRDSFIQRSLLPYFAVAWSPGRNSRVNVWRQRSTTSRNWRLAPATANTEVRSIRVADREVVVVLCGEGFSTPVRDGIVARKPSLAVLPAHAAGGGLRHWRALSYFRNRGVPALRAVHAIGGAENVLWQGRRKHLAVSRVALSSGDFGAEASVFTL